MTNHAQGGADEGLAIAAVTEAGRLMLRLSGELDLSTASLVDASVEAGLAGDPTALLLDLDDVSFVDSSGLAALLRAHRACAAAGVDFGVSAMSSRVACIVELAGIGELLPPAT